MAKLFDKAACTSGGFNDLFGTFFGDMGVSGLNECIEAVKGTDIKQISIKESPDGGEPEYRVTLEGEKKPVKMSADEMQEKYPNVVQAHKQMQSIRSAAAVDDDTVLGMINSLSEPDSRYIMSSRYRDLLGYDPTDYFDHEEIADTVLDFQQSDPKLLSFEDCEKVIKAACNIYDDSREDHHNSAIRAAMRSLATDGIIDSSVEEKFMETHSVFEDEDDDHLDIEDDLSALDDDEDDSSSDDDDDYDSEDD